MRIRASLGAVACAIAIAAMTVRPATAQRSITCASQDGKRHYCDVETRGGVSMVRQRSDAACEEGYSWGYDRRGIWVDHGCRAEFAVNADYGAPPPAIERLTLSCSSADGKRHYCPADTRNGVRIFHQMSSAHCTEGYSWGFDRHGVWVDHGCRADFRLQEGMR
jgi:Protein of unknown function (DUF3011)